MVDGCCCCSLLKERRKRKEREEKDASVRAWAKQAACCLLSGLIERDLTQG